MGADKLTNSGTGTWKYHASFDLITRSAWALASACKLTCQYPNHCDEHITATCYGSQGLDVVVTGLNAFVEKDLFLAKATGEPPVQKLSGQRAVRAVIAYKDLVLHLRLPSTTWHFY